MDKETMLGRIIPILIQVPAQMLGTLLDLPNRLVGEKGEETLKNLKHLLRGEFEIKLPSLLKWLGTTTTSPTTKKFVAKKKFRKDSKEIKFYGFYGSFEEDFLAGEGKIEEPLGEQTLACCKLTEHSPADPIIEELGGEAKAETTLTELYDLLIKKQENYVLLFIRNTSGALRAVFADWIGDGWHVYTRSVEDSRDLGVGYRVFSRNS